MYDWLSLMHSICSWTNSKQKKAKRTPSMNASMHKIKARVYPDYLDIFLEE